MKQHSSYPVCCHRRSVVRNLRNALFKVAITALQIYPSATSVEDTGLKSFNHYNPLSLTKLF